MGQLVILVFAFLALFILGTLYMAVFTALGLF